MIDTHITPIEEIRQEKIKKIDALKALGIEPYPYSTTFQISSISAVRKLTQGTDVAVVGRIYSIRAHGGISFADIKDQTGKIQLAFKKDTFPTQTKELLSYLDASDHIEVAGKLFITKAGELTIDVSDFKLLSKALRPIPTKEDSLQDKELRLRKRYLDLLTNPQTKFVFDTRHKIIRGIRQFFETKNLTEVETPILQPLYGGANARPFTTHINALDATAYLRIAPELYLKRLVVGGYEGVYEIARNFRNEGVDQTHFPEFTMLEAYVAYMDYQGMMNLMEELLRYISTQVLKTNMVMVHDKSIDLTGPWLRITMTDLLKEKLNLDIEKENLASLLTFAQKHNLEISEHPTKGELAFLIFDKLITHSLTNPTWVIDYPVEVSPLSKPHRSKLGLTERFELYIGGVELMDGWSELTDPIEQRKRFEAESYRQFDTTETAQPVDEDFLESLEYGLPPFAGVGSGIDRLTMFFTNVWSIQETILFPFKKIVSNDKNPDQPKIEYSQETNFTIQSELKQALPGIFYAYTEISSLMVKSIDPELENLKQQITTNCQSITNAEIKAIPSIKAYRTIVKTSGSDPDSHLPSPEALLKRVSQKKGLYTVNTAVDAYNLAVIETSIGLGGFDTSTMQYPISLRFAKEGETMNLLGKEGTTQLKLNQIIYADQQKPITMDLNYRDIEETKITTESTSIILFADGAPGLSKQEVLTALQKGADYIQKFCGGTQGKVYLVE